MTPPRSGPPRAPRADTAPGALTPAARPQTASAPTTAKRSSDPTPAKRASDPTTAKRPPARRPPRADAARNREQLLTAAEVEFSERGLSASVADITRRAGVAKGTFFRHFATKDDLITAIVEPGIRDLAVAAERLLDADDAGAALLAFMSVSAAQRQQNELSFLLRPGTAPPRTAELRDQLFATIAKLVERAQASGAIRTDVTPMDVFLMMCAPIHVVEYLPDPPPELWRRYLAILFDGLRPEGAHPLPHPPPAGHA